jgi:hypothetical protein
LRPRLATDQRDLRNHARIGQSQPRMTFLERPLTTFRYAATNEPDGADTGPVPYRLIAAAVQVYVFVGVRPATLTGAAARTTTRTPRLLLVQMT